MAGKFLFSLQVTHGVPCEGSRIRPKTTKIIIEINVSGTTGQLISLRLSEKKPMWPKLE